MFVFGVHYFMFILAFQSRELVALLLWSFRCLATLNVLNQEILEMRKGYFIDFRYDQAMPKVGIGWTKMGVSF